MPRQLIPARILIAVVALDALAVLALFVANPIVAIAIFTFSGTVFAVWAISRAREAARAIAENERRRAASGEGAEDA